MGSKTTSSPLSASRKTTKWRERRSESAKPASLSRNAARPTAVAANGCGERLTRFSPKALRSILPTSNTVQRLREYLTVLRAIRDDRTVDFHGSQLTAVDPSVLPVALAGRHRFRSTSPQWGPARCRSPASWPTAPCRPTRAPHHRRVYRTDDHAGGRRRRAVVTASSRWALSRSLAMSTRRVLPPPPVWRNTTQFVVPEGVCTRRCVVGGRPRRHRACGNGDPPAEEPPRCRGDRPGASALADRACELRRLYEVAAAF